MANYILPVLVFSTIFERLNIFIPDLGFSLKLSLIVLPVAALVLFIRKQLTFNATFLFPFLAFLILAELLSVPFSFDPLQSLQVVVFHLLMIGLFYLIVWSVKRWGGLDRLVWSWGAGAATVSLLGIWQFFRYAWGEDPTLFFERWFAARTLPATTFIQSLYGFVSWRTRWDLGIADQILRPPSTFIDVSTSASFVGIFLILGLAWFLSFKRMDLKRIMMGALLALSAPYFLLTLSRSAVLGWGVGMLVFGYLLLRSRINRQVLLAVLAGVLVLFLGAGIYVTSLSEVRTLSDLKRLEYARGAVEMFKRNPIAGVGAGNFEPYYTQVVEPAAPAGYPHSIILSWVGELGILGLAANLGLISAVFYFIRKLLNTLSRDSGTYLKLSGLAAAFAALVFANLFHAHYGLEFTWVLLGLLTAGYYLAKPKVEGQKSRMDILGVAVDNVTMAEAIGRVKGLFSAGKKAYVVTPNSEMVITARKDKEFTQILNRSDLSIPDTAGLVWASRIWGTPLKEWVAGTDLFFRLCEESARRGGQVFLLGGQPGVAERAAQALKERYSKIKIAGTFAGDGSPAGDAETVRQIKNSAKKPIDLLFIAYGHGKQERWIKRNLSKVPVKVAIGVGGAVDFAAGEQRRAPQKIRRLGFEWLYRLILQPWRIRRQWALVPFIFLTFRESFRR